MFLVLRPDRPRFTILAATDAYLQATRQRRIDIVGQSLFDVFPGDPDGASDNNTRASLDRVIELRMPDAMAPQRHDIVRPDAQGGGFDAYCWRPVNSPVMNASGGLDYLIHQIEEVTGLVRHGPAAAQDQSGSLPVRKHDAYPAADASPTSQPEVRQDTLNLMQKATDARRQAEQARARLQASEERLRLASDAAELGIWTWQPEADRLTWENARHLEILGLPRNAAPVDTARLAAGFVHPDDLVPFKKAFARMVRTGARLYFEGRIHCPNGALRWVELTGQPVRSPGGALLRLVGTVCDITGRKRSEAALQESRRFLRSSLDALSGLIAVLDESGTIVEVNQAWRRFALENQGSSAGVGIGVNYLQQCESALTPGGEMPAYARGIHDVITGRRNRFELKYPCHSPTQERWFVMRVTRFQSPGPVRVVVMHEDCTEQKWAEQALRNSEERYRSLFNSMEEGFCIIDLIYNVHGQAVDCLFLEINPAFAKQTGAQGIVGKRLREMDPRGPARWLAICAKVALTGKAVRFVYEHQALDSEWFDAYAVRLGNQDAWRVGIIFNNITLHKRAVDALRLSEQRFRALFDRGPVAMYSCDTSGMILEFNACAVKLWGRKPTPDDVDERFCGVSKVYRPDGALLTAAQNPMIAVLKGEIPQANDVEAVIERPDGSRITVIANIVPLKDGQGEITGTINCFYDITERSRLERQTQDQAQALAELHRRKDEFLAMLSHELRNPLAPLTSAVELLGRQENQDPVYRQACQVIERQVGQMKHLIDDLLEVSRITSGNVRLRKAPVRLGDIVERALETSQPLIARQRHQLTVSLPPYPVWLDADAMRLEQVLVNLLANAVKYTDEGGRIWLSVELEDVAETATPVVRVKVRDTGIGIAPELLPRIFDLFTQAECSIDRSQGGLGIGLCLVRRLVELHAGSVHARSVPGQGSEFIVRLPGMPHAMAPWLLTPLPVPAPTAPRGKGCRVLAVDDNVDAVNSLATLLKLSGHEVQTAYDGSSVLQKALAMRPDVVLLDIGLPGLTGYEVAAQIRREHRLDSTVLVALTGYGCESDRQRSKNAGFAYHLAKPSGLREVEKILATVSEQRALQAGLDQAVVPEA